ncbi:hypothetical protein KY495_02385 [Massilia sp. PAMC28688]|uniref:hypothetical protein n=1 Tax=Massilia sp. PAMC28688 TaxID=2861283 RepID=UPI001C630315|nr:hypothetical protein [Massilia sp. PAMC28688]QYF94108.1 hypothetical protein KY495_02385 [Massilia sp. PAMC28688]
MNASKLFAALATVAFAGSAFAADVPAANATVTAAAATAQVSVAAKSLAATQGKTGVRTRAEVRAEATEAVKNHRATEAGQFDWIAK